VSRGCTPFVRTGGGFTLFLYGRKHLILRPDQIILAHERVPVRIDKTNLQIGRIAHRLWYCSFKQQTHRTSSVCKRNRPEQNHAQAEYP
jgi:hypothetical protein